MLSSLVAAGRQSNASLARLCSRVLSTSATAPFLDHVPIDVGVSPHRARRFHSTPSVCASSDTTINPLQQAPGQVSATATGELEETASTSGRPISRYGPQRAHATLRGARISPRKLNQFVDIIRGQHIDDAIIQCQMHAKKAAQMTGKLLESARANAVQNHGLDGNVLNVEQAWVGKGQYLRRVSIHGRGRSGVMHKNRAHLTVVLKEGDAARRVRVIKPVWERRDDAIEARNEAGVALTL